MGAETDFYAEDVRNRDLDRYLASLYAPAAIRPALQTLFALDIALGRVIATTNEPMIGAMRIAWWRESLEKIHRPPVPAEPVLQAVAANLVAGDAAMAARLAAMTDAWLSLIEPESLDDEAIRDHAELRGGALFMLAAQLLGVVSPDEMLRQAGVGWAMVDLAHGVSDRAAADRALALARPLLARLPRVERAARPLLALAALARRDACAGGRRHPPGSLSRQMRMMAARLFGR